VGRETGIRQRHKKYECHAAWAERHDIRKTGKKYAVARKIGSCIETGSRQRDR
jgi:hypothetical protein